MSEATLYLGGTDSERELKELLKKRLSQIDEEREKLAQRRSELDGALNRIDEERSHIAALLGLDGISAPPVPADGSILSEDPADGSILSEDPADMVVRLLREKGPLHYRDIERELRARGWYRAGGAHPANTLLAKYFQDPRLYRPRRGVYAIRPEGRTVQSVGTRRKGLRRGRRRSASTG